MWVHTCELMEYANILEHSIHVRVCTYMHSGFALVRRCTRRTVNVNIYVNLRSNCLTIGWAADFIVEAHADHTTRSHSDQNNNNTCIVSTKLVLCFAWQKRGKIVLGSGFWVFHTIKKLKYKMCAMFLFCYKIYSLLIYKTQQEIYTIYSRFVIRKQSLKITHHDNVEKCTFVVF